MSKPFHFQQFVIHQDRCAMKVGMDGVLLGAWALHTSTSPATILDIGTGTGLLALMLAQRFAEARIDAVEINEKAAAQAAENVEVSSFVQRIEVFPQSIQTFRNSVQKQYDLIVSNPPYFANDLAAPEQGRRLARHTLALSHADLLDTAETLLAPRGQFCLILPWDVGLSFTEQAAQVGWFVQDRCAVQARPQRSPNRCLLQMSRIFPAKEPLEKRLCIYASEKGQEWSEAFKRLTHDFYLSEADRNNK